MSLANELKQYGSPMGADDFNELLAELHAALQPSWTVEELLYHRDAADSFVKTVQSRAGKDLPDFVILRRLQNLRKSGKTGRRPAPARAKSKPVKRAKAAKGRKAAR